MIRRLRRWITLALGIALLGAFVPPAGAHNRTSPAERYYAHRCGESSVSAVKACIHRAAIHWGVRYSDGLYIAKRETHYNPNICNSEHSGACGLFQFMPKTFGSTPYAGHDIFDAKWNALAWAWLYRQPGAPCVHWSMC